MRKRSLGAPTVAGTSLPRRLSAEALSRVSYRLNPDFSGDRPNSPPSNIGGCAKPFSMRVAHGVQASGPAALVTDRKPAIRVIENGDPLANRRLGRLARLPN